MSFQQYTDKELQLQMDNLQKEMKRRDELKKKCPDPLPNPDWKSLQDFVVNSIKEFESDPEAHMDDDFDHFVYEQVIDTIYGPAFWKWWNNGPGR